MKKLSSLGAALLLVFGMSAAYADGDWMDAPDPATINVPPSTCVQPETEGPKIDQNSGPTKEQASVRAHNKWSKSVTDYGKCVQAYQQDLLARAKRIQAVAVKINDVGNAAMQKYIDYMAEVNKHEQTEEEK